MDAPQQWIAVGTAALLVLVIATQLAAASGLPLGHLLWGGRHRVLPGNLRVGSVLAVLVLGMAAWAVLARADLVAPGADATGVRIGTWFFAAYFGLNTLANAVSTSRLERAVMTPTTVLLATGFVIVAQG